MIRNRFWGMLLAVSLVIAIPATVGAQDAVAGPEGERWDLVAYGVEGLGPVPWNIDVTLLLEDGVASGSTGCDRYSVGYELAGEALSFPDAPDAPGGACFGDAAAVEAGFRAALPQVATWNLVDDESQLAEELQLADAEGSVILVFARPVVGLTAYDIAGLDALIANQQADFELLEQRVDAIRIGRLRDRIKALEAQVASLQTAASSRGTSAAGFDASEKVLLDAIPPGIRQTCSPRRDENPPGTVAAVQCKPRTARVRDMAYYLMAGSDAMGIWQERMDDNRVKHRDRSCTNGKPGSTVFVGGYAQASGCYLNDDRLANLRYVVPAWDDCGKLRIGGKRVDSPVLYVAVLGPDDDLAKLGNWAEPRADARPTSLYKHHRSYDACIAPPPM